LANGSTAIINAIRCFLQSLQSNGPGSLVWLQAGRCGDRIPVGARFFAHVQSGHGAHPVSCTMGPGSFPGVKQPGRGADHPPPPSVEVENV
jgi:hypothetical protein